MAVGRKSDKPRIGADAYKSAGFGKPFGVDLAYFIGIGGQIKSGAVKNMPFLLGYFGEAFKQLFIHILSAPLKKQTAAKPPGAELLTVSHAASCKHK